MAKRKRYDDMMLLAPGESVQGSVGRYLVDHVIAYGAFGAVYHATDPDKPGRIVALKEYFAAHNPREQKQHRELFDREKTVGELASPHPLMPTMYEAFLFDGHFYIAQEFIEGVTLEDIIKKRRPLPREWILKWSVSVCDALAYLHARKVVHHDLKPANIRITPHGHLVLLDFGAAQYFGKGTPRPIDLYGTEGYLPPEMDGNQKWEVDVRTDIFALGCILYEMIAGEPPDQDRINQRDMFITNSLMERPNADLNLVRLINNALSYNIEHRYADVNTLLLDIRKIAPPVLLVTKKHLRFGDLPAGQISSPQSFTLYNAGGGMMSGEIRPRSPWIQIHQQKYQGNKRDIEVRVIGAKVTERNKLAVGRLEINNHDEKDHYDSVTAAGDRWFIDCSVTIVPQPGQLFIVEQPAANAAPIALTGRKGAILPGAFNVRNRGEMPSEARIGPPEGNVSEADLLVARAISISPTSMTVKPGETVPVQFQVNTKDLPPGIHHTRLTVRSSSQTLTVAIAIKVQSGLDFFKSKLVGG